MIRNVEGIKENSMTRLKTIMAALLVSSFSFAMSNGIDLTEAIAKKDPKAALYKKLTQATGYLALINSEPVVEKIQKNVMGFSSVPFDIAGCSTVYIKKPAYFLSSAKCFANPDGTINKHRQYAKVYVEFQPYHVDPVSIVVHDTFGKTLAETDFAIFSLEASEAEAFAKNHTPIDIVPEDYWMTEGQVSMAVGYGRFSEAGEQFGFAKLKNFIQRYPDASDLQAAGDKLNVGPQEHLLTYVTAKGDMGVNCKGDSGGLVATEMMGEPGTEPTLVLQGIILGKVGPDGNSKTPCEAISKYMVVADLRFESEWIEGAIAHSAKSSSDAQVWTKYFADKRAKVYGAQNPFSFWAELPWDEMETIVKPLKGIGFHQQNIEVNKVMQLESARRQARESLSSASTNKVAMVEKWQELQVDDPWVPPAKDWGYGGPSTASVGATELNFYNPKYNVPSYGARIRNIGEKPISYTSITLAASTSNPKAVNRVLQPGEFYDHFWLNNYVDTLYSINFGGFKGDPKAVRVDFKNGSEQSIAWYNSQKAAREKQEAANQAWRDQQAANQRAANQRAQNNSNNSGYTGRILVGGVWYDSQAQADRTLARSGWSRSGDTYTRTVPGSGSSYSSRSSSSSSRYSSGGSVRVRTSGSRTTIDWDF